MRRVDDGDEVILVSRAGLAVRFAEADARSMGRDTSGVRGMDVGDKGEVIAIDVARDDQDLLVITENGFGKRTRIDQYRKTSRGAKGVKTIGLTEAKGGLAGALVVRPHQELVFISQDGMVQRTGVRGISQQGRAATGVRVMNVRDDGPRLGRRARRRVRCGDVGPGDRRRSRRRPGRDLRAER